MKINNNSIVNFQGKEDKVQSEKSAGFEQIETQASANSALGSYGRAFVNMSFKGNIQNSAPITPEIKELTDEEFEEYKARLDEKIQLLPNDVQEIMSKINITKTNILLADKILSDENLYGNENVMENVRDIICYTCSKEEAEAKISVMDKLLSNDGELLEIESVKEIAGDMLFVIL